jgi:hypothetical protein
LDQRLLFANPASLNSSAAVVASLAGTPLILSSNPSFKNVLANNPMPLASAQPLSAQQTQQQQQAALLQQLGLPNGILATTPGPFGLALPQTSPAALGGGQFDFLTLSGYGSHFLM